jgi:hypothetical protein
MYNVEQPIISTHIILFHFVYLPMLLSQEKSLPPRCRVAKYILFPKIIYGDADIELSYYEKRFYVSKIYIAYNKDNATLYYMMKDVIYFHNASSTYIKSLVTLYDYKSGKYDFWKVGLAHEDSQVISESWYCVKAPNSNTYVVYTKWHSKNKKALCVYNLNKDKNLYCMTYKFDGFNSHPDKYSYILANSFVVTYKIERTNIYIYLVDLVTEKVNTIKYTLYDYLRGLLHAVNDETDKERITNMLLSQDFKALVNKSSDRWNIAHLECIVNKYDGTVPFIRLLKLHFRINAIIDDYGTVYKPVYKALSVSFSVERNKLIVQFATGTDGVIERASYPAFKVNIPPDVVLLTKRYNLNASYDIAKSYPYYIYEVTQNYIFTRRHVFEQSSIKKHEYILNPELSTLYESYGIHTVNGINVFKTKNNIMAQSDDSYSEHKIREHIVGFDVTTNPKFIKFVDLYKIRPFLQKEKYVDVSSYTFSVNIREKIISAIGIEQEDFKSMEANNRVFYHILPDTTRSLLYILVRLLPKDDDDSTVAYWLFKCSIRNPASQCEVITKGHLYKSNSVKDFISIAKSDTHLLEITNRSIYDNKSSYSIYGRAYIHGDGLIVINNILSVKVKDIRHNRASTLQYIKQLSEIKSIRWDYRVYQDNFLVCDNFIAKLDGTIFSLYYPLLFVDLKVVKPIETN